MHLFEKTQIVAKSYAKINLSLKIVGKNQEGYHLLEMVNLPLELHDVIEINRDDHANSTHTICDDVALNNHRHNLCTKAVEVMREKYKFKENFLISIHKEIPFAAGLGGGSSNAAAVIKSLATLLKINATKEDLISIGLDIGADVPFFLDNKPAKVTGIGEIVEPIQVKKQYFCLVVKPEEGLSTKAVYEICDNFGHADIDTESVIRALKEGDDDLLAKSIGNDLYSPAAKLLPEVKTIVDSLKGFGLTISGMSGSGSACFALSTDMKLLKAAYKHFEKDGYIVKLAKVII